MRQESREGVSTESRDIGSLGSVAKRSWLGTKGSLHVCMCEHTSKGMFIPLSVQVRGKHVCVSVCQSTLGCLIFVLLCRGVHACLPNHWLLILCVSVYVFVCTRTCMHAQAPEGGSTVKPCSQAMGTSQEDKSYHSPKTRLSSTLISSLGLLPLPLIMAWTLHRGHHGMGCVQPMRASPSPYDARYYLPFLPLGCANSSIVS